MTKNRNMFSLVLALGLLSVAPGLSLAGNPEALECSALGGVAPLPDLDPAGLWLFDEFEYPRTTLTDAGPNARADLRLMDGGMADGKFGRALYFRGSGHAVSYALFAG